MSECLKSKSLYKLDLFLLKLLPVIMSFSYIFNLTCAYYGWELQAFPHFLGISLPPLLFMYISSYVFKFCSYHRMFIHYITFVECLSIIDYYWGIPVSDKFICELHYIVTYVFMGLALILYIKKKRKDNLKLCTNVKDNKESIS